MTSMIKVVAWLGAVGLGLAAVLALVPQLSGERVSANDFVYDYLSARALVEGDDPYGHLDVLERRYLGSEPFGVRDVARANPHPPALIVALGPLGTLSLPAARATWLAIGAVSYILAGFLLARGVGWSLATGVAVGIGLLAVPVVGRDLAYGQSNGPLLLLMVLCWRTVKSGRWRALGGIALGVAGALKLFPLLLLIPLLRLRQIRAAVWAVGALIVSTLAASAVVGFGRVVELATDIGPQNAAEWGPAPMNLSLVSIPRRWLTTNRWYEALDLGTLATVLAALVFIALIGVVVLHRGGRTGDLFWSAIPVMLLASPITWDFSLPLVLPLALQLVRRSIQDRQPPSIPVMVALTVVAIGVPPGLPLPEVASPAAQLLGYALPTYALVILAAVGMGSSERGPTDASAEPADERAARAAMKTD